MKAGAAALWLLLGSGCTGLSLPPAGGGRANGPDPSAGEQPLAAVDFERPWTLIRRVGSGKSIDAITHGPAGYLALTHVESPDPRGIPNRNNIAALSVDGVSWSETAIVPDGHYRSVAHGAGLYVAVGGPFPGGGVGTVLTSTDGRSWRAAAGASAILRHVRFTAAGFLAVGDNRIVLTSPDGVAWSETQPPGWGMFWDGNYGAGRFVAVGNSMAVRAAAGNPTWSEVACGAQLPCMTVVDPSGGAHGILQLYTAEFGNGVFLASGVAGLLRSTDGLAWTRVGEALDPLVFGGGRFLSLAPVDPEDRAGTSFRVSWSSDGVAWAVGTTASSVRSEASCAGSRCLLLGDGLLLIP